MGFTRRAFLQQLGAALAAWGVSESGLWMMGDRYRQVLAAPTPRKLALLVGINQYPGGTVLEGCVTDVELQRELLTHRFGFQSTDIITLTDQQATQAAVETAFMEHLIQQARSGDVVVFHFSGFGSILPAQSAAETEQPSLVMADAPIPGGEVPIVGDMLRDTLGLLLRSLKTDQVTTILDTSYTYPGNPLQGNLRIRSHHNPSTAQPTDVELSLQTQLLSRLNLNRQSAAQPFDQLPGVILAATDEEQWATEANWNRFSAGLFTYALTQSLWQSTPATSVQISLGQVAEQVRQRVNQQHPQLRGQKSKALAIAPYFSTTSVGAEGTVISVDETGKTVQLWLGGLPAPLLEQYGIHSLFKLLPVADSQTTANSALETAQLQITAREGLTAKATVCCTNAATSAEEGMPLIQVGQLVQETVRVLPRNIGLTVALDGSLERIERVDAISAFSALPHISSAIAGEQPADYLFSKVPTKQTQLASLSSASLSVQSSYGLFSLGRDVILNTTGEGGEAVKVAVRRLVPKLQTLLAAKLLNLTVNQDTSQLKVRATLEMLAPQERLLRQRETMRTLPASAQPTPVSVPTADLLQVPMGSRIRYRVENQNPQPIYTLLLVLDSANNLVSLHTPTSPLNSELESEQPAAAIAPQTTVTLPIAAAGADWTLQGPPGLAAAYLICSVAPFAQSLAALATGTQSANATSTVMPISNPLEVAQAILDDLHRDSQATSPVSAPDAFVLDVNTWTTLHFVYQVG
ncbi:MAG: peptidase C14 [Leptolyngbyaceae cyanobacterium RU_5_1]|nr:peptidase C14 [Leptolyngbyaceae cyanobacterium RU_5_1]